MTSGVRACLSVLLMLLLLLLLTLTVIPRLISLACGWEDVIFIQSLVMTTLHAAHAFSAMGTALTAGLMSLLLITRSTLHLGCQE